MKKLLALWLLVLSFFSTFAQPVWKPLTDVNSGNAHIDGGSVRTLLPLGSGSMLIGGEFDSVRFLNGIAPYKSLIEWIASGDFGFMDCTPGVDTIPIEKPAVYCSAIAYDSAFALGGLYAIAGRFTRSDCGMSPWDMYQHMYASKNIQMWDPNFTSYYQYFHQMTAMDTVFAIAMSSNKPHTVCINTPGLKMYVGARRSLCTGSPYLQSGDTTAYISMYDPALTCNFDPTPNYMQGGTNGPVYAIVATDSAHVYAGGLFDSAGIAYANNIAMWNGVSWSNLGGGVNGKVKAICVYKGKVYVGGVFTMAGNVPANNIAMWDGTQWTALGTGTNGAVYALGIHKDNLIVGGAFSQAGSSPASNIAKWNGNQWFDLGGGRNNEVYTVASFQNCIYAGGNFTGGTADTAKYIAYFNDTLTGTLGIKNYYHNSLAISVYPNPSTGIFTITKETSRQAQIVVYDFTGRAVLTSNISNLTTLDLTNQAKGIYYVTVTEGHKTFSQKLVVQ
jgi:hypothetical protein